MNYNDCCPNCFKPLMGNARCPSCGNDYSQNRQYPGVLAPFTILNNRYLLGRVLGKGGFGITYIAKDMATNRICAVKEYMPSEYSTRNGGTNTIVPFSDKKAQFVFTHGRDKFMDEAKTLLKLRNNPIVVDILDFFTQNNTAYLVMEYLDGQDLRKLSKTTGGKLDPEFAKIVLLAIASSLMEIHRLNILHRDISPENIIVTSDGMIKLIDFGAARNFVSTQNKGMSILLKPGFAPPEQYNAKGTQGPWSDVYALCATFYTLVSGKPLVDALFRYRGEEQPSLYSLGCPVTKKTSDVIERGMELDYKRRYKDFKELLDDIDITTSAPPPPKKPVEPERQVPPTPPTPPVSPTPPVRPTPPVSTGFGTTVRPAHGSGGQTPPRAVAPAPRFAIAAVVGNTLCNKVMLSTNDIFKIGRSAQSCQYVVSGDTNISRIHCYLRFDGKNVYITDSSSNGTFLENGTRLVKNKEYVLNPGTKFYLATRNHTMVLLT